MDEHKQIFYMYECLAQPCASRHDGVCVDLRVKQDGPPVVRCPMCGKVMFFRAREDADDNGYRPGLFETRPAKKAIAFAASETAPPGPDDYTFVQLAGGDVVHTWALREDAALELARDIVNAQLKRVKKS